MIELINIHNIFGLLLYFSDVEWPENEMFFMLCFEMTAWWHIINVKHELKLINH